MQRVPKQLKFPLAGIAADIDYGSAMIPVEGGSYATPKAVNVLGDCVFSGRRRGGSRPALVHHDWIDAAKFHEEHEQFAATGLILDGGVSATAKYRGRIVAASGALWYMSAIADETNWEFNGDSEDPSRAAAGNLALANRPGEDITAIAPLRDSALVMATEHTLWVLTGDPLDGTMKNVSENVGIVSRDAWCYDGTTLFFMGVNGLYATNFETPPMLISSRLGNILKRFGPCVLGYDEGNRAVHITNGANDWYFDIDAKAFWRLHYNDSARPVRFGTLDAADGNTFAFVCADGVKRVWDDFAEKDDGGMVVVSSVDIGPFRCGMRDDTDGMLDELSVALAEGSSDVKAFCYFASSPEVVVARAVDMPPDAEFSLHEGLNGNLRPRRRGAWCLIRIASSSRWAYESALATVKTTGRLR